MKMYMNINNTSHAFSLSSEQETPLPGMAPRCQGGGGDVLQQHKHLLDSCHRLCWRVRCHGGHCLFPLPLQGLMDNYLIVNPIRLYICYVKFHPWAKILGDGTFEECEEKKAPSPKKGIFL